MAGAKGFAAVLAGAVGLVVAAVAGSDVTGAEEVNVDAVEAEVVAGSDGLNVGAVGFALDVFCLASVIANMFCRRGTSSSTSISSSESISYSLKVPSGSPGLL